MTIPRGLATNPFSAARFAPGVLPWFARRQREEPDSTDGADEIARLFERATSSRHARHQVTGPHGSGKSTLLCHLEAHGRRTGADVVRVRGSRGWPFAAARALRRSERGVRVLIIDEVEELGLGAAVIATLAARLGDAALIVSTHRDLGLTTLAERRVDGALAQMIVAHLTKNLAFALPSVDVLDESLRRHDHNLREVLFELYDRIERGGVRSEDRTS